MHWLHSAMATRFNRFRAERGHPFQGRYQSTLVEDFVALGRLVDYLHLNPVRARIVPAEQVMNYRWSSLRRFVRGPRMPGMMAADWLAARGGWYDDPAGRAAYERHLVDLGERSQDFGRAQRHGARSGGVYVVAFSDHRALIAVHAGSPREYPDYCFTSPVIDLAEHRFRFFLG